MKKEQKNALGETFAEAVESQEKHNNQVSILDKLVVSSLPELAGWKEKQETLVSENPYVEITDNATYATACKSRTNLLKGRTSLESQDKLIASKLTAFRKSVGDETKSLIAITLPHEEKQQTEVKRYEGIKETERLERDRIENERISAIKNKIKFIETDANKIIQSMDYISIISKSNEVSKLVENDANDFEEFDILFVQAKARIESVLKIKVSDLTEKENARLENERLAAENSEAKRLTELQANRLTEIMPYVSFGEAVDLTKLSKLSEDTYTKILTSKKALFNADALAKETAENERIAKEKKEKDAIFNIRKNRLAEIGVFEKENEWYCNDTDDTLVSKNLIYECDTIRFEEIISESKEAIRVGNEIRENAKKEIESTTPPTPTEIETVDAETVEEPQRKIIKLPVDSVLEAIGFKELNPKFANDKKALIEFIESLEYQLPVPEMENVEMQGFLEDAIDGMNDIKKELIETINKF